MVQIIKEWKELYRSSLLLLTAGLVVLTAWFVLFQYNEMNVPVTFRTGLIPIFQTSIYFLPLLATFYGAFSMALEKNQGTLPILVARGLPIQKFVLKKFLALISVFIPTITLAYLIAMIPAKMVFNGLNIQEFAVFLLSMIILATIFIAIGVLLGSVIHQKLTLIGFIVGLWLGLIYLFDLILMYWVPSVSLDGVLGFSIVYFLSPIHAVQYFLFVQLNVYQLSNLSVIYEQFTFQNPWVVLLSNTVIWIGAAMIGSIVGLKRKGVFHD
ncbi:ABC transporter permease [Oceanobacillus halotolerans]|uniref:ABC transporter permease n=1 Tax=Oceanobacillus halotolerans TaxID=2663380 RepID=UPI0013DC4913|nr:ABC transporter permease subunit [Oceanobacillus halotolerans]